MKIKTLFHTKQEYDNIEVFLKGKPDHVMAFYNAILKKADEEVLIED